MKKMIYPAATILQAIVSSFFIYYSSLAQEPEILWNRTYFINSNVEVWDMELTSDGNMVIAGSRLMSDTGIDFYLIKIDVNGNIIWTRNYGGPGEDQAYSVRQTSDGGFIICGFTSSFGAGGTDIYLVRTDSLGDTLWTRTYGGMGDEEGRSVELLPGGKYAVAGWTSSFGSGDDDIYLLKIDSDGDSIWTRTLGTAADERAWSVKRTPLNRFAITGWMEPGIVGNSDVYFLLTDSLGNVIVSRNWGGNGYNESRAVIVLGYVGFVIVGKKAEIYNDADIYVIRTNSVADTVWTMTYDFSGYEVAHDVIATNTGEFVVGGYSLGDSAFILKVGVSGTLKWIKNIFIPGGGAVRAIAQMENGEYFVAGYSDTHVFLIKLSADQTGVYEERSDIVPDLISLPQVYPNPFNSSTSINYTLTEPGLVNLSIFNIRGQRVAELLNGIQRVGEHSITWDASDYPSGVYLARLEAGGSSRTAKMVLLK